MICLRRLQMSNYTNTEYQETNLERKGVCLFERKKELKKLSLYYNIWQITILISFLRGLSHEKKWKKRKISEKVDLN